MPKPQPDNIEDAAEAIDDLLDGEKVGRNLRRCLIHLERELRRQRADNESFAMLLAKAVIKLSPPR